MFGFLLCALWAEIEEISLVQYIKQSSQGILLTL